MWRILHIAFNQSCVQISFRRLRSCGHASLEVRPSPCCQPCCGCMDARRAPPLQACFPHPVSMPVVPKQDGKCLLSARRYSQGKEWLGPGTPPHLSPSSLRLLKAPGSAVSPLPGQPGRSELLAAHGALDSLAGSQLTCQDGIHPAHHVSCIVHTEAHWGLELKDVPPGAVSAQQDVVLLHPVRTGHGRAIWPRLQPQCAWGAAPAGTQDWPPGLCRPVLMTPA